MFKPTKPSITFIHIIENVHSFATSYNHMYDFLLICACQTDVASRVTVQLRLEAFTSICLALLRSTAVAFGKTLTTRGRLCCDGCT
jgi:hypothetical protein